MYQLNIAHECYKRILTQHISSFRLVLGARCGEIEVGGGVGITGYLLPPAFHAGGVFPARNRQE